MKLNQSEYFRHILTLLSGSAAAQLILLLSMPMLSRLYLPEHFGVFALFFSLTALLGMVASGRYEVAIFLPKQEKEAFGILRLVQLLALCSGIVLGMVAVLWNFTTWNEESSLYTYRFIIPLAVVLHILWKSYTNYANRQLKYKAMTSSRVSGSIITVAVSIILGFWNFNAAGLVLGKLAGLSVETFLLHLSVRKLLKTRSWRLVYLLALARKYANFLKFSTVEGFINRLYKEIPVFALSGFFSAAAAGYYSLAQRATGNPVGMLSGAIGSVFFPRAVRFHQDSAAALRAFYLQNLKWLAVLIVLPSILIISWGPRLFAFVFGEEWYEAGIYARWLMPYIAVTFLKSPLSSLVDIKNKLAKNLAFEVAFLLASSFAFFIAIIHADTLSGIQIFSIANAAIGLVQLYWFYTLTGYTKKTY